MVKKAAKKTVKKAASGASKAKTGAKKAPKKTMKKTVSKKTPAKRSSKRSISLKNMSDEQLYGLISEKAYELYLKRGSSHGNDHSDWYRAESFILSKYKK